MNQPPYDDNIKERGDDRGGSVRHCPGPRLGGPGEGRSWIKMSAANRRSMMPGPKQTNLFFRNIGLSYSTSAGLTWGRVFGGLEIRKEVRSLNFGPAPRDCRITPGSVPPDTRARQNLSSLGFCQITMHFTDHLYRGAFLKPPGGSTHGP